MDFSTFDPSFPHPSCPLNGVGVIFFIRCVFNSVFQKCHLFEDWSTTFLIYKGKMVIPNIIGSIFCQDMAFSTTSQAPPKGDGVLFLIGKQLKFIILTYWTLPSGQVLCQYLITKKVHGITQLYGIKGLEKKYWKFNLEVFENTFVG